MSHNTAGIREDWDANSPISVYTKLCQIIWRYAMATYDCLVVGGGPAGLTAGMYASRAGLKTAVLEGMFPGGQITTTPLLENYPGFPEGVNGADFGVLLERQATHFGVEVLYEQGEKLELDGPVKRVHTASGVHEARTVILCVGAEPRLLGLPQEEELRGRGVSYCATCDGAFFRDRTVAVVGGGDTACEDTAYLTRMAKKVYLIHRRDTLRASAIVAKRVTSDARVETLWDTVVEELVADDNLKAIRIRNVKTNESRELPVDGVFVAIGILPRTDLLRGQVELNRDGYIITDDRMATNIPGVFAAGDARDTVLRQMVTAAADGAIAATAASDYLMRQG